MNNKNNLLLVAGGAFGRSGYFRSGTYAMQTRGAKFYPMAMASPIVRR